MKKILILLLLVPSLSWGDAYIINLIKEIHSKINSENITSNQADFYLEKMSLATNQFTKFGNPCYDALINSNSENTYHTNLNCLLFASALGMESNENRNNIDKLYDIIKYFQDMFLFGKFDKSYESINKKRSNDINNMGINLSVWKEVILLYASLSEN